MKLYEHYYESNFEELLTYYPRFYFEVFEMREILKAEGKLADAMECNIEQTFLNCFIDCANDKTIQLLEEFLGITLNKSRLLEERRRLVKSYFVGLGKVSATTISELIQGFIKSDVKIRFEAQEPSSQNVLQINIYFRSSKEANAYMSDIRAILSKKIPAHIDYKVTFHYKIDGKAVVFTGVGLSGKHRKIRTEVKNYGLE